MKGNNWGGKRAGAGRKKSLFERKGRTFRLTDAEFLEVVSSQKSKIVVRSIVLQVLIS